MLTTFTADASGLGLSGSSDTKYLIPVTFIQQLFSNYEGLNLYMKTVTIIHILLSLVSGALLIGYGEFDDSPGAQGIGLLTVITSLVVIISMLRRAQ